jgi:hypothetical protein
LLQRPLAELVEIKRAAVVLTCLVNVCAGAPASVQSDEVPKHKKNPSVGTKKLLKLNKVCLCLLCSSQHGGVVSVICSVVPSAHSLVFAASRVKAPELTFCQSAGYAEAVELGFAA